MTVALLGALLADRPLGAFIVLAVKAALRLLVGAVLALAVIWPRSRSFRFARVVSVRRPP